MGLPELIIAGMVVGGAVKADAQSRASAYQAAATRTQGQQAVAKTQADAVAVQASAAPALATAQAATYNAQIAKDQAALTLQSGQEEERRYRISASDTLATGRAAAAASGIEVSGSALDVLANNAQNAELNALTIRHKAVVQANSYLNAQTMDQFQAAQARSQAGYIQQQAGYISSTAPSTAAQYEQAARITAETGSLASVSTLLETGTKVAGSGATSGLGSSLTPDITGLA